MDLPTGIYKFPFFTCLGEQQGHRARSWSRHEVGGRVRGYISGGLKGQSQCGPYIPIQPPPPSEVKSRRLLAG